MHTFQFCKLILSTPATSIIIIIKKLPFIHAAHTQILEALHYLHAICKLIHRNLTPANILIGSNDNWKLSGLEFALRFESATISESASIMAHEGASGSLLRYSLGSANAQQKTLRRQKTLVSIGACALNPSNHHTTLTLTTNLALCFTSLTSAPNQVRRICQVARVVVVVFIEFICSSCSSAAS